jgi:N-acetylated-alpha-linked acidic dipeptidase
MRIDRVRGMGIAAALPIFLALSAAGCSRESLAETGGTRAEAALADVRPDEMWSIVESFSKIDRTSSSPGELQAAAQLEAALERLGIPYRRHEIRAYISVPVSASLEIRSPERFEVPAITPSFSTSTSGAGLDGPLTYVGPRDPSAVMTRSEDFPDVDLSGRIALLRGYPDPDPIERAERAGAIGAVCIAPSPRLVNMIASTVWGNPTPDEAERFPAIPIVTVNEDDGRRLEALAGSGEVGVRLQAATDTGWKTLPLLVAEIRGAVEPERFVLIGNHIDSWHEGVTDSATGVGALLEVARVIHAHRASLRRSLRVAWWPGHSTGRYAGSTWYADNFFKDLYDNGVAHMAIDSPGVRSATAIEPEGMFELKEFLEAVLEEEMDGKIEAIRNNRYNDESFWGIGLPSLTLYPAIPLGHADRAKDAGGSAYGYWWHTVEDSLDKADRELLVRDTRLYLALLWPLLTRERLPFDFVPVARQMRARIETLSRGAGEHWDFGPTLRRIDAFEDAAAALQLRSTAAAGEPAARFNATSMAISRALNPALYTCAGPYRHDPALLLPLFPCLSGAARLSAIDPASDRAEFLKVGLLRESNRVHRALDRATAAALEGP